MIQDIVERAAPDLTIGEIEATSFAIPHLVFADPTRAADAISAVNAYHLYDWGVYDGEFFYRATDPDRLTWQARLSSGAHLDFDGDTAAQVFNGVLVHYTDPLGKRTDRGTARRVLGRRRRARGQHERGAWSTRARTTR